MTVSLIPSDREGFGYSAFAPILRAIQSRETHPRAQGPSGLCSTFMSTRNQGAWLFGSIPDLFLGAGLLYLLIASSLIAWGGGARETISPAWIAFLILIVSGSHYGGTLLRVYEHAAERRTYRLFILYGTIVMFVALVGALYSPVVGSALITLYLTWSPWHYTGQNYGISVMFLRRRGVDITPVAKRLLHASFILSFFSVFLTMHIEGSGGGVDPLGYSASNAGAYQFVSIALPSVLRTVLMPVVGLAYVATLIGALTLLVRAAGARAVGPTALLMLTQAVWFSIPYMGSYFEIAANIPALNAIDVQGFQFYFVWVALGHAAQYLWITTYYARVDTRWRGYGRYFSKVFIFGNAAWAGPVVLFGPETLGRLDFNFGLAMCVAAAVNLHHFMLDGVIWKLRNPKLAAVLLRGQRASHDIEPPTHLAIWVRRSAWSIAILFCLAKVLPEIDLDHRFPTALQSKDYQTAESILDRAATYGRDSSILRMHLAKAISQTRNPARSIPNYRRSLELHPHAPGFVGLGELSEKIRGVDQALIVWKDGLEKFPDDFDLIRHVASGYLKINRPDLALPYLERAVAMHPEDEQARIALAETRARLRR
jgi:tetratricopeptide (TPR) repeat protein